MRSWRECKQERSVRIELWATVNNERSGRGGGSSRGDLPKWLGKWSNQESLVFYGSQVKKVILRTSVHLCQRLQTLVPVVLSITQISSKIKYTLKVLRSFPGGSDGKASAYNAGDPSLIPGLGRSSGEGNGNPLQYSCLEYPMDRRAW